MYQRWVHTVLSSSPKKMLFGNQQEKNNLQMPAITCTIQKGIQKVVQNVLQKAVHKVVYRMICVVQQVVQKVLHTVLHKVVHGVQKLLHAVL